MRFHTVFLTWLFFMPSLLFSAANQDVVFPVILDPIERTPIFPEVVAKVVKIPKKMGDSFKKGDLLLQLDNNVFKANAETALKDHERAEIELNIKRHLANDKLTSILELKDAEVQAAKAKANLVEAQHLVEASEFYAPYDGKVANVLISLYELPMRERLMYEYFRDDILTAKILVPAPLIKDKKVGDPIHILLTDQGEILTAPISRIGSFIEPNSSSVRIEAEIDNSAGKYVSGMSSLASFSLDTLQKRGQSIR